MNLNYINFNTSLGEMLTSAVGENIKADLNENSVKGLGKDTAFAEKLMALLSPETKQTSTLLNSNFKGITGAGEDLFDTGKGTSDDPVLDFINEFKNYLKMAGVVLENATIDKKGIAALEELLVAQGFSREDIKGLVADLMDEDTELTGLAELVDGLETLDLKQTNLENEEEDEDSIILPISDLPFITSILTALGIPEDFSKNLLSEVKEEGVGINLDGLIQGLQGLQKQSFLSGISYTAGSQTGGVEQMFQALGLEGQGSDNTPLTLGDFVTALEQMRISNDPKTVSNFQFSSQSEVLNAIKFLDNPHLSSQSEVLNTIKSLNNPHLSSRSEVLNAIKSLDNPHFSSQSEVLNAIKSLNNPHLSGRSEVLNAIKSLDNPHLSSQSEVLNVLKSLTKSPLSSTLETAHFVADTDIGQQSDTELLLNTMLKGINQDKNQGMKSGNLSKQEILFLDENDKTAPMNLFEVKVSQKIQASLIQQSQGTSDPEIARLVENVELAVKDLKTASDDTRVIERDGKNSSTAKSSRAIVSTLESSDGANGTFKDMGMGLKNQAASTSAPSTSRSVLPSYVTSQVVKSLARAVAQGDSELKLQLRPPELGRIIMTIDNLGSSLKVSVVTENQAAKDILTSHANELKSNLASSGISIASFDVEMGSDFKQSMADARPDTKGSGSKRSKGSTIDDGSVNGIGDSTINTLGFTSDTDGVLHFVA